MTGRLAGRTALVTGAASGIGRAIALRFGQEGANVLVCDIREQPIWDSTSEVPTAKLITARGGTAEYFHTDVSDTDAISDAFRQAAEFTGRIDIVVSNAALLDAFSVEDTDPSEWDRIMAVNLRGQYLVAREAVALMRAQVPLNETRGRIITVSSQFGLVGPPDSFAYAVAKGGIVQMTRQLAVDYGREGILVNSVAPGKIPTRAVDEADAGKTDTSLPYSLSRTPFHRLGRPEDVAGAALFLASDDCSFVSGHVLSVDGGWTAS